MLGFIYYTSLDQKIQSGDFRVISLTYLAPAASANQLYSHASNLSGEARELGDLINKKFVYGQPIPKDLEQRIFSWGTTETEVVQEQVEVVEKPVSLLDLYSFFAPSAGFRKYEDPLAFALLGLLMEVPVVLSGPDPKHLLEFANLLQKIYQNKELRIELTLPGVSKFTGQKVQKIPRADIVLLKDEQYKRSFFSRDPLVILTTYQEYKTPYHKFDDRYIKIVSEWIRKSREVTTDEELALRIIKLELDQINDMLNNLLFLADGNRTMNQKSVMEYINKSTRVQLDRDLMDFITDIALYSHKTSADALNKLLNPLQLFTEKEVRGKDTIGMVS